MIDSSTISLRCTNCSKQFEKPLREHNRRLKLGKKDAFCSLSCSAIRRNEKLRQRPKSIPNGRKDEYSPFRYYLRRAKSRPHGYDIDLQYIKELWEKQKGLCAFSYMPLRLYDKNDKGQSAINLASLDRIDSSKGYMKGNVQFVSAILNYAKLDMEDVEFRNGLREMFECYSVHLEEKETKKNQ